MQDTIQSNAINKTILQEPMKENARGLKVMAYIKLSFLTTQCIHTPIFI
jgi:hypothetical protein